MELEIVKTIVNGIISIGSIIVNIIVNSKKNNKVVTNEN